MSEFKQFQQAINEQFTKVASGRLYKTNVTKEVMWDTYLGSFPEGTNPIFRERTEHDCQCCKQFIRAAGNVVGIVDNKLVSIWDVKGLPEMYQVVADALSALVKSKTVCDVYLSSERDLGVRSNIQLLDDDNTITWNHFYFKLERVFVKPKADIGGLLSNQRSTKDVFKRGLEEIALDSIETVLELIDQNSLYRGEEHKSVLVKFLKLKKVFDLVKKSERDNYCWSNAHQQGSRIRNSAIGTLLTDLSNKVPLDDAVKMFESKVAPANYKRPTALITKAMIRNAQEKVVELGIEDSLPRRFAVAEDITIDNVLFADRSVKKAMNVFDELADKVSEVPKSLDKVEEVSAAKFIEDILPKIDSMELLFENKHSGNLMSLIAPINADAKPILQWGNNFSWVYSGEVTDSMKERVKKAGGSVTGVLRFSIQWNDGDENQNDFDAHCVEPNRNVIYYANGKNRQTGGNLDVDITHPGSEIAVENITWPDKKRMGEGEYHFYVNNFAHNGGTTGFTAEIEYADVIYSFTYNKGLRQNEKVTVAKLKFSKKVGIEFISSLPSTQTSKELWDVSTNKFQKVTMVMNSPNHWDGEKTGNKHLFFILEGCKNPDKARGFFNEFLDNRLTEHRKVLEVLGSKMKAERSDKQLSGLGFSTTQRNTVVCRVSGSFNRTIKIKF